MPFHVSENLEVCIIYVYMHVLCMDLCVCSRFGAPCVTLVMRELTALTSREEKSLWGLFFSVVVEFNCMFLLLCV